MSIKTEIAAMLRRAAADPRRSELGLYAASGTYYLFLSLGPLTALLLALLPYTLLTEGQLTEEILSAAPPAFRRLMQGVVLDVYAGSRTVLGVSLAAELWSGARFLSAVTRGVAALAGDTGGGYLRRRVRGAVFTLALIGLILGDLILLLFGKRLLTAIAAVRPAFGGAYGLALRLRPVILLLCITAANALLFRYAPTERRRVREVLPWAALSAVGWMLFTRLCSGAMERAGPAGVYGSIAAAAVTLYWSYVSLYILFFGAWLCTVCRGGPDA